jgi:hypothetical protein
MVARAFISCYALRKLVKAEGEQGRGFERFYPTLRMYNLNALELICPNLYGDSYSNSK